MSRRAILFLVESDLYCFYTHLMVITECNKIQSIANIKNFKFSLKITALYTLYFSI